MTDLLSSSQFWLLVSIGFYALGVEIQKENRFCGLQSAADCLDSGRCAADRNRHPLSDL